MYCLWQVSVWQLQYSPVSCSAWTIHPEGRIPPPAHPAPALGADGCSPAQPSILELSKALLGLIPGKSNSWGFPGFCTVLELSLGAAGWEVLCPTAPPEWHLPQRRNCGTEMSIQTKNQPWKLVGSRVMEQSWRKEQPWAIFRILSQFIQAERSLTGCGMIITENIGHNEKGCHNECHEAEISQKLIAHPRQFNLGKDKGQFYSHSNVH